jgi:hypothetical protein
VAADASRELVVGSMPAEGIEVTSNTAGALPELAAVPWRARVDVGHLRPHRVECWCVQVREPDLPSADRIAHLLLALRADETGFATVANMAFSGAPWRVRARMPRRQRPALQCVSAPSRRRMRRRIASDDA